MKPMKGKLTILTWSAGLMLAWAAHAQKAPAPVQIPLPPQPPAPVTIPAPAPFIPSPVVAPAKPVMATTTPGANPGALVWDAEFKESVPKTGDATAPFTFWFTNTSSSTVVINSVRTSCGCTTAKLPAMPWSVPAGSNGPVEVVLDLRGKSGAISKAVTVDSTAGVKSLIIKVTMPNGPGMPHVAGQLGQTVPAMNDVDRVKNMQAALADRQVVFKDPACAKCHAEPAQGKIDGHQLYAAVCGTCHDSPQRAALVPDLRTLKHETDTDYWKQWIANGRVGSMMPAFEQAQGGPLNAQQIAALADYCVKTFHPVVAPVAVTNASAALPPLPKIRVN